MTALRLAGEADLPQMLSIVAQAQAFLRAQGVDQWQDGYPNADVLREDISQGNSYVLVREGEVCGIAAVIFTGEPTYDVVHDGAWTTPEPFACIHRIAVDGKWRGQGLADTLMAACEEVIQARGMRSVRIDTHHDNRVMQRMLARNGYQACGVIYLADGAPRVALEKAL